MTERSFELVAPKPVVRGDVQRVVAVGAPLVEVLRRVLVDGRDPVACGDERFGLACRVYETPDGPAGSPTIEQLEAVIDA